MAGDWHTAPLDGLVEDILDRRGVTPLKLGSEFVSSGHRVISAKGIKRRRVDLTADEPRFVDRRTYEKWMKSPLRQDDVIVTSEAPLGELAYVSQDVDWCLGQRLFAIRTKKDRLLGRYLFYSLQSEQVRHELMSRATGTTAQGIRQSELRRVLITFPHIDQQRTIAHILGSMDDKIELNRRINETLEAMARALFKSWFVDFDPVRTKAEGHVSWPPATVAALFPDSLEVSQEGEIPRGWRYQTLGELIDLKRGTTYKGNLKGLPGPVLLGLASIERNGGFRGDNLSTYGGESPRALILVPGDIYASLKDVTQSADLLGAVARVPPHIPEGRLTQDTVKLTYRETGISTEIIYRTLLTERYREYCRAHATGTTNLGLSREDFLAYPILEPGEMVRTLFDSQVKTLDRRAASTREESRTLAALRDTLLPKLISGELRVKDAETIAARAL